MDATLRQRSFTVDEFHRLGEAGILGSEERVELLDGQVLEMAAIGSRHAACVRRLIRMLGRLLPEDYLLDAQNPVHVDEGTELVPDLSILRARPDYYAAAHPRPEDLLLLIEVADTTLHYDRNVKMPRYGAHGIRESWLVDLRNACVERFHEPSPASGYLHSTVFSVGASVESTRIPGLSLAVKDILGATGIEDVTD